MIHGTWGWDADLGVASLLGKLGGYDAGLRPSRSFLHIGEPRVHWSTNWEGGLGESGVGRKGGLLGRAFLFCELWQGRSEEARAMIQEARAMIQPTM